MIEKSNKIKRALSITIGLIIGLLSIYIGSEYFVELIKSLKYKNSVVEIDRFTPPTIGAGLFFVLLAILGTYQMIVKNEELTPKLTKILINGMIVSLLLAIIPLVLFPTSLKIYLKKKDYIQCNERTDITSLRQQILIYAPNKEICEEAGYLN
ncbi:MAG TPA: hypothetical protein DDW29_15885 [Gammaproteobacteria bacterium]|nr:hypothetical protein [Gammaproteobacteria bacterium]|tara:strand:- start:328 stop:786 length:459 start_codon:yes stop_codon:yes gene_type:complete